MNQLNSEMVAIFDVIRECERKSQKATLAKIRDRVGYPTAEQASEAVQSMLDLNLISYNEIMKRYEVTDSGAPYADNQVAVEVVLTPLTRKQYFHQDKCEDNPVEIHVEDLVEYQHECDEFLKLLGLTSNKGNCLHTPNEDSTKLYSTVKLDIKFGTLAYSPKGNTIEITVDTDKIMLMDFVDIINEDLKCMFGDDDLYEINRHDEKLTIYECDLAVDFADISKLFAR